MDQETRDRLTRAGFRIGNAGDFLGLDDEERRLVEMRVKCKGEHMLRLSDDDRSLIRTLCERLRAHGKILAAELTAIGNAKTSGQDAYFVLALAVCVTALVALEDNACLHEAALEGHQHTQQSKTDGPDMEHLWCNGSERP